MEKYKNYSIKDWALEDRPRERLMAKGVKSLSNTELIAILIGSGTKKQSAVDLAKTVLNSCEHNLNELAKRSVEELQQIKGIGQARAINIMAAMELARRQKTDSFREKKKITCSRDAYEKLASQMIHLTREEFRVMYLNKANRVLEIREVSSGGISGTVYDLTVVFKLAILLEAPNLILSHNHPSGNLQPSEADKEITKKTITAGKLMNIHVVDHLIIGENGYYSFADEGLI
jgi:DNA repair protein RadC